mgnify:CR=1 FL=1
MHAADAASGRRCARAWSAGAVAEQQRGGARRVAVAVDGGGGARLERTKQVAMADRHERRADATVTGKKSSTATLFKQPGTKSEKVKSLAYGTEVKTIACVSGGKDTWCAAVVSGDDGEGARGWMAQSRLEFDKVKDEK